MTEKLSIREKVGFSLGDSAANFIFQTMMLLEFRKIFVTICLWKFILNTTAVAQQSPAKREGTINKIIKPLI